MRRLSHSLVFALAALLAVGPLVAARAAGPAVKTATPAALRNAIAAQRGKVVVVNFWATWCPGCVHEFPDLAKTQKSFAAKGVSVVFVSGDDLTDRTSKVAPFLARHGVKTPSWIMNDPMNFGPQFDKQLKGAFSLPRTYVYDRKGKLVKTFEEEVTYATLAKTLKPLL